MGNRSRAGAPPVFELRSASMTLVVVVLKTTDMAAIQQALTERFGDTPGMFDHDPVVVDVSQAAGDPAALDWPLLAALLSRFDMVAAAVRGGTPEQMAAALASGLGVAPEANTPARAASAAASMATDDGAGEPAAAAGAAATPAQAESSGTAAAGDAISPDAAPAASSIGPALQPGATALSAPAEPPAEPAPAPRSVTLFVDRPLRSGQQVYARGGDLVVLAAVNFGAEVIADGSIHVYAPLRGKAVAGAKGDTTARIFSTCMEPELIAIAGTYRTTDSPLPDSVLARPAQIRLDGERLVFEPIG